MIDSHRSYRQILRSTSIIGGASVLHVLIGLVRVKVAALILGPTGVGLIGLFNNLVATASNIASLGTGIVGTRQIAEAAGRNDEHAVLVARRALFWGTLAMASVGAAVFWILRLPVATYVLRDAHLSAEVGWLALAVGLTVAGGSQVALLNGLRRIGDLARVSVYAAAAATALGVAALAIWREQGLLVYLLLTPVTSFLVAHWYVARLPKLVAPAPSLPELIQQWSVLAKLGMAFLVAGLAVTGGHLLVRSMVQREMGLQALGLFEASWVISATYVGFILRAMGTDYYPRLTAVIADRAAVNQLVNEQTEVALLLAGPFFMVMLGFAPWVIELLYSTHFAGAAPNLRWQVMSDMLKLASWPLGFIILAAGDGRTFVLCETLAMAALAAGVWTLLPVIGLEAVGVALCLMYAAYLPLVYWLAVRRTGFHWRLRVKVNLAVLLGCGCLVIASAAFDARAGAALGLLFGAGFGLGALARFAHMSPVSGPLAALARVAGRFSTWVRRDRG